MLQGRLFALIAAAPGMLAALVAPAGAAPKQDPPAVERSASGTVIQPTTTIIRAVPSSMSPLPADRTDLA
jgi:hypothetical protein